MNNIESILGKLLESNPNIMNNPQAQNMIDILRSNDQAKGEEFANNLLRTYGVSKEDALKRAKEFFNL